MPGEECNAMRQERLAERDEGWIKSWEEWEQEGGVSQGKVEIKQDGTNT